MALGDIPIFVLGQAVPNGFFEQRKGSAFHQGSHQRMVAVFVALAHLREWLSFCVSDHDSHTDRGEDVAMGIDVNAPLAEQLPGTMIPCEALLGILLDEM
jgi:hypothetical protein